MRRDPTQQSRSGAASPVQPSRAAKLPGDAEPLVSTYYVPPTEVALTPDPSQLGVTTSQSPENPI